MGLYPQRWTRVVRHSSDAERPQNQQSARIPEELMLNKSTVVCLLAHEVSRQHVVRRSSTRPPWLWCSTPALTGRTRRHRLAHSNRPAQRDA